MTRRRAKLGKLLRSSCNWGLNVVSRLNPRSNLGSLGRMGLLKAIRRAQALKGFYR